MIEINKDFIPLILERSSAITTYILNNELLGSEQTYNLGTHPYKAFELLTTLYNNEHTRKAIPKRFHQYLSFGRDNLKTYKSYPLVGEGCSYVIQFDLITEKQSKKPVLLKNINYLHSSEKKLGISIRITGEEAFMIFANILTNALCDNFDHFLKDNWLRDFEQLDIRAEILESIQRMEQMENVEQRKRYLELWGYSYLSMNEFALEYLKYIKENILSKQFTPYFIQHFSGSRVLVFLGYLQPVRDYFIEINKKLLYPEKLSKNEIRLYCHFLQAFRNRRSYEEDEEIDNLIAVYSVYAPLFEKFLFMKFL